MFGVRIIAVLLFALLLALSASAAISVNNVVQFNQMPEELTLTVTNNYATAQTLGVKLFAPIDYEIEGALPASIDANKSAGIKMLLYPKTEFVGIQQKANLQVSLGSNIETREITLKFYALDDFPAKVTLNSNYNVGRDENTFWIDVTSYNKTVQDMELEFSGIEGIPSDWNVSPKTFKLKIPALETRTQTILLRPASSFDGNAMLKFSALGFGHSERIALKYDAKGAIAGFAALFPKISPELALDILLAIVAALLLISFIARFVHRAQGKKIHYAAILFLAIFMLASANAQSVQVDYPYSGIYFSSSLSAYFTSEGIGPNLNGAGIYLDNDANISNGYSYVVFSDFDMYDPSNCDSSGNSFACSSYSSTGGFADGNYFLDVSITGTVDMGDGIIGYETITGYSDGNFAIDNTGPAIANFNPANGSISTNLMQPISAQLSDASGININSITMAVEGIDYTLANSQLSYNNGAVTFTPSAQFAYNQQVDAAITASDSLGNYSSAGWSFTVLANTAPQISALPDRNVLVNSGAQANLIDLWAYASDAESADAQLAFTIVSQSDSNLLNCSITSNQNVSCAAPDANSLGTNTVTVRVTDSGGFYANASFNVNVIGNFSVQFSPSELDVEIGEQSGASVTIKNNSASQICPLITAQSTDSAISASASPNNPCIDANSSTAVSLAVSAGDSAAVGKYGITLNLDYGANREPYNYYINIKESLTKIDLDAIFINYELDKGDNESAGFTVKNTSSSKICMTFSASSSSPYVKTALNTSSLCLNGNEQSTVSLGISATSDAVYGGYSATFTATYSASATESVSSIIGVRIEQTPAVELSASTASICRGSTGKINVLLKNNYYDQNAIVLKAESEMFLPYFSPDNLLLPTGSQQYAELAIRTNSTTKIADNYKIAATALLGNNSVREDIYFNVIDCAETQAAEFTLDVNAGCIDMNKNSSMEIPFSVGNISDEKLSINATADGDLISEVKTSAFSIEGGSTYSNSVKITTLLGSSAGTHNIELFAYDAESYAKRIVCINVANAHATELSALNPGLQIKRNSADELYALVKNIGDYGEDYTLSVSEGYDGISAALSDSNIYLNAGNSKQVSIKIDVSADANAGAKSITLKASGAYATKEIAIAFEVVSERILQENVLRIESYPQVIDLNQGAEQQLTFIITNPTNEKITNISISIEGLPGNIYFNSIDTGNVDANSTITAIGTIKLASNAGIGDWGLTLRAASDKYVSEKPMVLYVRESAAGKESPEGALVGLFALGPSLGLGLLALVIIIAFALALRLSKQRMPSRPFFHAQKR